MAVYEYAEFKKVCGITNGYLKTYVDRGKVILNAEGKVDDKIEANSVFMKKCISKKNGRASEAASKESSSEIPPEVLKAKPEKGSKQLPINTSKDEIQTKKQEGNTDRWNLETELKQITLRKAQNEERMQLLREEKFRGELLPLKISTMVIKTNNSSIVTEMKNFIDQWINIMSIRKSFSSLETAEIKGEAYKALNESVAKAAEVSRRTMEQMAEEFSNTRGVGEHG